MPYGPLTRTTPFLQVVENDKEGISAILDWLSFVPKNKYSPPPVIDVAVDSPERDVDFQPTKTPYDPRHMLAGTLGPDGRWVSGFFDKGSFIETLAGWGKSVVTGRAKLGTANSHPQPSYLLACTTHLAHSLTRVSASYSYPRRHPVRCDLGGDPPGRAAHPRRPRQPRVARVHPAAGWAGAWQSWGRKR